MVDLSKQILVMDSMEKIALREERRRTGRYIAACTAIFLSLLGVYQAVVRGTPQYAALFAPALIMFIYILWILNASKNQQRHEKDLQNQLASEELSMYNTVDTVDTVDTVELELVENFSKEREYSNPTYGRSYSIA